MASSGRRRDRPHTLNTSSGEDAALDSIARRAEEMLQEKRMERERARKIRMKEIEKQQREEEDHLDRHFELEKSTGTSRLLPSSNVSTGPHMHSRRSSLDSTDSAEGGQAKDLKVQFNELEEKYRRSMMTNAQLDNEKQALIYQVEELKDQLQDIEETHHRIDRELKERQRQLDVGKRSVKTKEQEVDRLRSMVHQRDELIKEHKLVLFEVEDIKPKENGIAYDEDGDHAETIRAALISHDLVELLQSYHGTLEDKIRSILNDNKKLKNEVKSIKEELESERDQAPKRPQRKTDTHVNGVDMANPQVIEMQRESARQISEYKLKLQKAELDIVALESSVNRLESQVKRYKEQAELSEQAEDELKAEKRRMQRELREAQQQIEELETQKNHLQNRLDRIRQARKEVLGTAEGT